MVCADWVTHLTVEELWNHARDETAHYRRGEAHDDTLTYELFRRAVVERDDECWRAILDVYHERVLSWCLRSGADPREAGDLVAAVWVRFWQSFTPDKLAHAEGSTSAVLGYVKLCARSVVLDEVRRRARFTSLDELRYEAEDVDDQPPEIDVERLDAPAFWWLVDSHLRDDRDRVVVHLAYEVNLRPAEIQRRRPDLFPTVQDVYRTTRNLLDRLRNSKALIAWWSAGSA
jgi:DNA-directed RNA polymerase specialized sigma24 family protein